MSLKVLLVQTEAQSARVLNRYFKPLDAGVDFAFDLGEAATHLAAQEYDLLMLSLEFASSEWQDFLEIIRTEYPKMKIILTISVEDRERELRAQETGTNILLRQPFTPYAFNRALRSAGLGELASMPQRASASFYRAPQVTVPLGVKLTLPFLVVVLLVALGSAVIATSYFNRQAQTGFDSQVASTSKLASTWMASQQSQMNQTLRLMTNAQGMADAIQSGNSQALRLLVLPVAANSDEETVEILNKQGISLLSLRKTPEDLPGLYDAYNGETFFQQVNFVEQALQSKGDASTSGLARTPWGNYLYICRPVNAQDGSVVGTACIGRSPERIAKQLEAETQTNVTFYDTSGKPLASTLFTGTQSSPLNQSVLEQVSASKNSQSPTRSLEMGKSQYSEILNPWTAGNGASLGTYGLAVARSPLIIPGNLDVMEILSFLVAAVLIVILMGLLLANSTTARVRKLTQASAAIASGNTNIQIDTEGGDEFATLAKSFRQMTEGLQEVALTRDVLGHSATPELREELRHSMALQNLRLEGQEMRVTILIANLPGFPELLKQAGVDHVFEWLNEYYGLMAPIIHQHGGIIHAIDGESMSAYFGVLPTADSTDQSARAACSAAVDLQKALAEFNAGRAEAGDPEMTTNIAINTGPAVAGALGFGEKVDYILLGQADQEARSLTSLTPVLGEQNSIYLSQDTATAIQANGGSYSLQPLAIRDRKDPASERFVYRLLTVQSAGETEVRI